MVSMDLSTKHPNYFEGILQLRNRTKDFDSVLDYVMERIGKDRVRISKALEHETGVDLYVSSKKFLHKLGKSLAQSGCTVTLSPTLFSKDKLTSKNVYRLTVCARLPDYATGDVVNEGKRFAVVKKVLSGSVVGLDLTNGKTARLKKPALVVHAEDILTAQVVKTRPHLEVLHPETYEAVVPANAIPVKGESVRVVLIEGRLFLVPE
jgi:NMD protein affecting ribosome stability and mRNA decay